MACLSNLENMSRAWSGYAEDHSGALVGNLDGGTVLNAANSNQTWVLGWLDFSGGTFVSGAKGGSSNTNLLLLTDYSPLASYLAHSRKPFKCPADPGLAFGKSGPPRVRSISMNAYMGERSGPFTAGYRQFTKLSEIVAPKPSGALVFVDEREESINDGWFAADMTDFDPPAPQEFQLIDVPADRHNRAANLSFADGHAETWRWQDPRTTPLHGQPTLGGSMPNNFDIGRLLTATSSRVSP